MQTTTATPKKYAAFTKVNKVRTYDRYIFRQYLCVSVLNMDRLPMFIKHSIQPTITNNNRVIAPIYFNIIK